MNTHANAQPESRFDAQAFVPSVPAAVRPFYWSLRRELWENRFVYVAPLAVAGVFLLGFLISLMRRAPRWAASTGAQQVDILNQPYSLLSGLIMATTFVAGILYCLDALHGERRDRSILFWKSLPLSDRTVVLSKAAIAIVILPLLTFAVILMTQTMMLLVNSAVWLMRGLPVGQIWSQVPLAQSSGNLLYHLLTVHALWEAPLDAWLILVSAWARRAVFLWAALPPFAIGILEKIAFNTSHFAQWMGERLSGPETFSFHPPSGDAMYPMATMRAVHFLTYPGLWLGLALAALFLFAAMQVRRNRGPI